LSSIAHICVGLSVDKVAFVFGKHVHPTEHFAPIVVLSGRGIPELIAGEVEGWLMLYSIIITLIINDTRENIKRKMENSSI
jgi:hypothetical protein